MYFLCTTPQTTSLTVLSTQVSFEPMCLFPPGFHCLFSFVRRHLPILFSLNHFYPLPFSVYPRFLSATLPPYFAKRGGKCTVHRRTNRARLASGSSRRGESKTKGCHTHSVSSASRSQQRGMNTSLSFPPQATDVEREGMWCKKSPTPLSSLSSYFPLSHLPPCFVHTTYGVRQEKRGLQQMFCVLRFVRNGVDGV